MKSLDQLIDDVRAMPCTRGSKPDCIRANDLHWGGTLSEAEWYRTCPTCLAYWLLQAARNELIAATRNSK